MVETNVYGQFLIGVLCTLNLVVLVLYFLATKDLKECENSPYAHPFCPEYSCHDGTEVTQNCRHKPLKGET